MQVLPSCFEKLIKYIKQDNTFALRTYCCKHHKEEFEEYEEFISQEPENKKEAIKQSLHILLLGK